MLTIPESDRMLHLIAQLREADQTHELARLVVSCNLDRVLYREAILIHLPPLISAARWAGTVQAAADADAAQAYLQSLADTMGAPLSHMIE